MNASEEMSELDEMSEFEVASDDESVSSSGKRGSGSLSAAKAVEPDPELLERKNIYEDENLKLLSLLGLYEDPEETARRAKAEEQKALRRAQKEKKRALQRSQSAGDVRKSSRLSGKEFTFLELRDEYDADDDSDNWTEYEDENGQVHRMRKPRQRKRRAPGSNQGWGLGGLELYKGKDRERYHKKHLDSLGTCKEPYPHFGEEKVYSQSDGSTCHQCRQKIIGDKSSCSDCGTLYGWFCGTCLQARYGENLLEVVEKNDWRCPSCRDICNCSICRNRKGFGPTGALAPRARREGYASAAHYLVMKNYVNPETGLKQPLHPDGTPIEGAGEKPDPNKKGRKAVEDEDDDEDEEEEAKGKSSKEDEEDEDEEDEEEDVEMLMKRSSKKKDPHMPRRGRSAYMLFVGERSKTLREEEPGLSFGQLGKRMGEEWKKKDKEAKKVWEEKSKEDRKKQTEALREYLREKKELRQKTKTVTSKKREREAGQEKEEEAGAAPQDGNLTPVQSKKRQVDPSTPEPQKKPVEELGWVEHFQLVSLGKLQPEKEAFLAPELLVPAGYEVVHHTNIFSTGKKVIGYRCRIGEKRGGIPEFSVEVDGLPETLVKGATPTEAWKTLLRALLAPQRYQQAAARGIDGAELFGLEHEGVAARLQQLPGREKLVNYLAPRGRVRWVLHAGDLVAVRPPAEESESVWVARVVDKGPFAVYWRFNKREVRVRWFEATEPGSGVYRETEHEDSILASSIFHAQFADIWKRRGPKKWKLAAPIAHFDV